MIGERMLRMSTRCLPSDDSISPADSLLPTKRLRVIHSISSLFMRKWPPHHFSNSRKRARSVSTLRVEVVELGPVGVRGIEALEVVDEVGAVELAVPEVAGQRGQPGAAEQAARCSASGSCPRRRPSRRSASRRAGSGPTSWGASAASIMSAQPPWQLPMTNGLPSACGCSSLTFCRNAISAAAHRFDGLARHRLGKEHHEIARMAVLAARCRSRCPS